MKPMVSIRGLNKSFGALHVLKDIDVDFAKGQVTCVIGPSGSGKSTMLRCINRLAIPDSGLILVADALMGYQQEGRNFRELSSSRLAEQRAKIGMVFQHFNLFPHLTVLQNIIEAPMRVLRIKKAEAMADAFRLLEQVGLVDKAGSYPDTLSGGQMQRIAIARALAMKPELILFDEPTSALDPEKVGEVLDVLRDLARTGMTMIIVTHEIAFARDIADDLIFMADGKVVERGVPTTLLDHATHPRTREFLSLVL